MNTEKVRPGLRVRYVPDGTLGTPDGVAEGQEGTVLACQDDECGIWEIEFPPPCGRAELFAEEIEPLGGPS